MSRSRYSRRRFLSSVGLGAAALPLLEADDARGGCLAAPPKRVIFVIYANGNDGANKGYVTGGETDFALPGWMKTSPATGLPTLEDLRRELIIIDGLQHSVGESVACHEARPAVFTPVKLALNDGHTNHRVIAGGPSIDQVMASALQAQGQKTLRPVLNLGVRGEKGYPASWRGRQDPAQPERDPFKLVSDLFGGVGASPAQDPALARRWEARKLVLEHKRRELESFRRTLGQGDRIIVESWLSSLRELQAELMAPVPASGGGCGRPAIGDPFDVKSTENHAKLVKAQMDVTVAALAADVSRVAMLALDDTWGDGTFFTWLGPDFARDQTGPGGGNNHHAQAHKNSDKKMKIDGWYHGQLAYLIHRLQQHKEGTDTLLDNTLVVFTNDGRNGGAHSTSNVPWMLAGGKNMGWKRGRYLKGNNAPKQRLLLAIANAFGVEAKEFSAHGEMTGLR